MADVAQTTDHIAKLGKPPQYLKMFVIMTASSFYTMFEKQMYMLPHMEWILSHRESLSHQGSQDLWTDPAVCLSGFHDGISDNGHFKPDGSDFVCYLLKELQFELYPQEGTSPVSLDHPRLFGDNILPVITGYEKVVQSLATVKALQCVTMFQLY